MKPLVKQLKQEGFDIRVIDVQSNQKKAIAAEIRSVPTFIHFANGAQTTRFTGSASARTLKNCFRPR